MPEKASPRRQISLQGELLDQAASNAGSCTSAISTLFSDMIATGREPSSPSASSPLLRRLTRASASAKVGPCQTPLASRCRTKGLSGKRSALRKVLEAPLTEDQARRIYRQGESAVVFALLTLSERLSASQPIPLAPSTPSGMVPPYQKPAKSPGKKRPGRKAGHPGSRRLQHVLAVDCFPSRALRRWHRRNPAPGEPRSRSRRRRRHWDAALQRHFVSCGVTDERAPRPWRGRSRRSP